MHTKSLLLWQLNYKVRQPLLGSVGYEYDYNTAGVNKWVESLIPC